MLRSLRWFFKCLGLFGKGLGLLRLFAKLQVEALLCISQLREFFLKALHVGDALLAKISVVARQSVGIGVRALTEQLFHKVIAG